MKTEIFVTKLDLHLRIDEFIWLHHQVKGTLHAAQMNRRAHIWMTFNRVMEKAGDI